MTTAMIPTILARTPPWVWALLAALLALGAAQTVRRQVSRSRLVALPAALLALGVWGLVPGLTARPAAALMWALAFGAAVVLGRRVRPPASARWRADRQRLELPGSWLPLGLITVVFATRYVGAVTQTIHPGSLDAAVLPLAALYGAVGGFTAGRAWRLLGLTRHSAA